MRALKAVVVFLLILSISACGRKTAPEPPEEYAPKEVVDLVVQPTVESVNISWSAPIEKFNGDELDDLIKFVVKKSDKGQDYSKVEEIQVESIVAEQEAETSNPAAPLKRYTFSDDEVEAGQTYFYKVYAVNDRGYETEFPQEIRVEFIGQSSGIRVR